MPMWEFDPWVAPLVLAIAIPISVGMDPVISPQSETFNIVPAALADVTSAVIHARAKNEMIMRLNARGMRVSLEIREVGRRPQRVPKSQQEIFLRSVS